MPDASPSPTVPNCAVCRHPERAAIDAQLVARARLRDIGAEFSLSKSSVHRHRQHLAGHLARAHDAVETVQATNLLAELERLRARTDRLLAKVEATIHASDVLDLDALKAATPLVRELRACLSLLGEVSGELARGTTVNILQVDGWSRLRGRLIQALDGFPGARQAVVGVLRSEGAA